MQVLKDAIKKNEYKPVYLLYGSERYLVTLYKNKLAEGIKNGDDGMNFNSFEGKGIDWNEVISIAETLPFFNVRRLILLENTGLFKSANDFADYLPKMPESTHIIFCETEVDKRNRLYKAVAQLGTVCEMNGLEDNDLRLFIGTRLQKEQKKITDANAAYLLDTVGPDMQNLCNELEKLICYTLDRDIITRQDIDRVCIPQISGKVFQLTEAIGIKNKERALSHYNTMMLLRERPLSILFQIIRHFNQLLQVSDLLSHGKGSASIASTLGIKSFIAGKLITQCRNFSPEVLRFAVEYGTELETRIKTGLINEKIAIEFLIVKIITM